MMRPYVFLVLAACSASVQQDSPFSGPALMDVRGDQGNLVVEMRTAPSQPPTRGNASVELVVHDATTGAPVDGLSVVVVPWMPAHGHGTSVVPTIEGEGDGRYLVTNISFFMPGDWELRTSFSGSVTDRVAPSLEIP